MHETELVKIDGKMGSIVGVLKRSFSVFSYFSYLAGGILKGLKDIKLKRKWDTYFLKI